MEEQERLTLSELVNISTDDELVYRVRQATVIALRLRYRGYYVKWREACERLAIALDEAHRRDLQPYDGGWYELTAPSELGRWL